MRDMSLKAATRKARSRVRAKQAGVSTVTLDLSPAIIAELREVANLTDGNVKEVAQFLVRVTAARHRQETEALRAEARRLAARLDEFNQVLRGVASPGMEVMFKGHTYRHEDWQPLATQLGAIQARLVRRGWSRERIERFCSNK